MSSYLIKPIKNVKQQISGTATSTILSDATGNYNTTLNVGNYTIKPTKNNDIAKKNGVSAFDVILIQNHILNKIKLNSPYKIIAADVTNDKKVSAFVRYMCCINFWLSCQL